MFAERRRKIYFFLRFVACLKGLYQRDDLERIESLYQMLFVYFHVSLVLLLILFLIQYFRVLCDQLVMGLLEALHLFMIILAIVLLSIITGCYVEITISNHTQFIIDSRIFARRP